jgi:hypothetical protein
LYVCVYAERLSVIANKSSVKCETKQKKRIGKKAVLSSSQRTQAFNCTLSAPTNKMVICIQDQHIEMKKNRTNMVFVGPTSRQ